MRESSSQPCKTFSHRKESLTGVGHGSARSGRSGRSGRPVFRSSTVVQAGQVSKFEVSKVRYIVQQAR